MSDPRERRQQPRFSHRSQARYARGNRIHPAQVLDISASGAQLLLEHAHSAPSDFRLELGGRVELLAHTVWSERDGEGRQRVGVRFASSSWGWDNALRGYLASIGSVA